MKNTLLSEINNNAFLVFMFVCVCSAVTDHQIEEAVDAGVTSFTAMKSELGVASGCGTCECEVKRILETKLNRALASRTPAAQTLSLPQIL